MKLSTEMVYRQLCNSQFGIFLESDHEIVVSSRKQKTLLNMFTWNLRVKLQTRKRTHWVKPFIAVKRILSPSVPSISAKLALVANICELLTLFWFIFVYLHIVSGFVVVICLLPWCSCLFVCNAFLPINNKVPLKFSE